MLKPQLFFFSSPNAFVFFQLFLLDIVFLTFAHLREEIFYARKCHFFLTNVRLKDPKEITAKAGTLVNRLCVGTSCSWPRCSVVSQLPQAIGTVAGVRNLALHAWHQPPGCSRSRSCHCAEPGGRLWSGNPAGQEVLVAVTGGWETFQVHF